VTVESTLLSMRFRLQHLHAPGISTYAYKQTCLLKSKLIVLIMSNLLVNLADKRAKN